MLRETIIGTLGTIYGMDAESQKMDLQKTLHRDLTPGGGVALLIFFQSRRRWFPACRSRVGYLFSDSGDFTGDTLKSRS